MSPEQTPPRPSGVWFAVTILLLLVCLLAPAFHSGRGDASSLRETYWYHQCALCEKVVRMYPGTKPGTLVSWRARPEPELARQGMPLPAIITNAYFCPQSPTQEHKWSRIPERVLIRDRLIQYRGKLFDLGGFGAPELDLTLTIRYEPYGLLGYPGVTVFLAGTGRYSVWPVSSVWLAAGPCALTLLGLALSLIAKRLRKADSVEG